MEKRILSQQRHKDHEEKSKLLEQLYVHDVYERLALDFEDQQYQPWPKVKEFLLDLEPGSLVADIGCGNGHYLDVNPNIAVLGIDRSSNLLNSANHRASGVTCRGDCLSLPYRDNLFDAVLFIGVIHHLVSSRRQTKALQELSRIVRPNGTILLYTWAWEQQKRKFNGQNLLVPRSITEDPESEAPHVCNCYALQRSKLPIKPETNVLSKLERIFLGPNSLITKLLSRHNSLDSNGDSSSASSIQSTDSGDENEGFDNRLGADYPIEVPIEFQVREFPASSLFSTSKSANQMEFRVHSLDCMNRTSGPSLTSREDRYYHVFKEGELEKLVKHNTPDLEVVDCVYTAGHWCATLRKISP